jgi:hypothetical protein
MESKDHISENIAKAGKKLPFIVPDGYFDRLPSDINDKLYSSEADTPVYGFLYRLRPRLVIAFSLIILIPALYFGIRYFTSVHDNNKENNSVLVQITQLNSIEIEEDDLVYFLALEKEMPTETDALTEYLIIEEIDLETIIENL